MSSDSDLCGWGSDRGAFLAPNEAAVWVLDRRRSKSGFCQAFEARASEDDRRCAARFPDGRLRERYLVDHGFLRAVLAQYVARSPAEIPIVRTPLGKPYIADPSANGLHFSMSHSGDLTLAAVAFGREIGVDVERVRHDVCFDEISRTHFSPGELEALAGLPGVRRTRAFFTIWVGKEALTKAWGCGISTDVLRYLHVGAGPVREIAWNGARWGLQSVDVGADYVAALAATPDVESRLDTADGLVAGPGQARQATNPREERRRGASGGEVGVSTQR